MTGMFLAMTLFPEVQRKAQVEIDAIVGPDRLPTLSDRQSLPYMEALLKEIHRWHPIAHLGKPLYHLSMRLSLVKTGVPHRTSEDDIHNGYYIPKGSLVFANIWWVTYISRLPEHIICSPK